MFKNIYCKYSLKVLCVLLAVLHIGIGINVSANTVVLKQSNFVSDGYEQIAENGGNRFCFNTETQNFYIENVENGNKVYAYPEEVESDEKSTPAHIFEMQSLVVITVYDSQKNINDTRNSFPVCVKQNKTTVSKILDGVRIEYDFSSSGVKIALELTLADGKLCAFIPKDGIVETEPERYKLIKVALLPMLINGKANTQGNIILPDGCGELVSFSTEYANADMYEKKIYGRDQTLTLLKKENTGYDITTPYIAVCKPTVGILSTPTSGAALGYILANPPGKFSSYSNAYYVFEYRATDYAIIENAGGNTQGTLKFNNIGIVDDVCVEYSFLFSNITMKALADIYGNSLGLNRDNNAVEKRNTIFDIYGMVNQKASFLGVPYTRTAILSSGKDILNFAKNEGFENGIINLCNITANQKRGTVDVDLTPIRKVISKKQMNELLGLSTPVYIDYDPVTFTKNSISINSYFSAAKTLYGSTAKIKSFLSSTYLEDKSLSKKFLVKSSKLNGLINKGLRSINKNGYDGVSSKSIAAINYFDYDQGGTLQTQVGYYEKVLKTISKNNNLILSNPYDYAYKYCSMITDLPLSCSNNSIGCGSYPFIQMALSNRIAYCTETINLYREPQELFLKAILTGSRLHYTFVLTDVEPLIGSELSNLYSVDYSGWKDDCKKQYEESQKVYQHTDYSGIVDYSDVDGVVTATFENGSKITVNFATGEYSLD